MAKIITFGELMLRLQPEGYVRISQTENYKATFAGAEANVAVSLANFNEDVAFVSIIPDTLIGQAAVNSLRKYGVDTGEIVRTGERLGLFYLEKGASQRASVVIYDRKNSAISLAKKNDFNWDEIFENAEWFHFTGITPALSDNLAEICIIACQEAKKRNITISCDLNYRKNLWSKEKANKVMNELCKYIDVCIANEEDIFDVFGISSDINNADKGIIDINSYKIIVKKLYDRFNMKLIAVTLRKSKNANINYWTGLLYDGSNCYVSKEYEIYVVDRVGGGDSFGAGLIYALKNNFEIKDAVEFATAASCLKQTLEGDYNQVTVAEVLKLVNGNSTGRIDR